MLPDSARQSIKIVVDLSWWTGLEVEGVINAIYDRRAGRSPRDEAERERGPCSLARSRGPIPSILCPLRALQGPNSCFGT